MLTDRLQRETTSERGARGQTSTVNFIRFFHNRVSAYLLISDSSFAIAPDRRENVESSINWHNFIPISVQLCSHSEKQRSSPSLFPFIITFAHILCRIDTSTMMRLNSDSYRFHVYLYDLTLNSNHVYFVYLETGFCLALPI